jgi:hypothetical protein
MTEALGSPVIDPPVPGEGSAGDTGGLPDPAATDPSRNPGMGGGRERRGGREGQPPMDSVDAHLQAINQITGMHEQNGNGNGGMQAARLRILGGEQARHEPTRTERIASLVEILEGNPAIRLPFAIPDRERVQSGVTAYLHPFDAQYRPPIEGGRFVEFVAGPEHEAALQQSVFDSAQLIHFAQGLVSEISKKRKITGDGGRVLAYEVGGERIDARLVDVLRRSANPDRWALSDTQRDQLGTHVQYMDQLRQQRQEPWEARYRRVEARPEIQAMKKKDRPGAIDRYIKQEDEARGREWQPYLQVFQQTHNPTDARYMRPKTHMERVMDRPGPHPLELGMQGFFEDHIRARAMLSNLLKGWKYSEQVARPTADRMARQEFQRRYKKLMANPDFRGEMEPRIIRRASRLYQGMYQAEHTRIWDEYNDWIDHYYGHATYRPPTGNPPTIPPPPRPSRRPGARGGGGPARPERGRRRRAPARGFAQHAGAAALADLGPLSPISSAHRHHRAPASP